MKPAIIIIDMQNDFFVDEPLKTMKTQLVENINQLTDFAREHNAQIIWVHQVHKADGTDISLADKVRDRRIVIEGTAGANILEELHIKDDEIRITKKRYSAFYKTNFEEILKTKDIDTLILAGVNTHACVRMTAIDAFQRDLKVVLALDCINSWNSKYHDTSLEYLENSKQVTILTNEQIFEMF